MKLNIIHRADPDSARFEAFKLQQDYAHELGLKTTMVVTYPVLFDKNETDYIKNQSETFGDEIAIAVQGMLCEDFKKRFDTEEPFIFLQDFEKRKAILRFMFDKFNEIFGFYPGSIASYYLDAQTLCWIHSEFPTVKLAIMNCFEEGNHMFEGTQHQWYLFTDGGPWGPYYPSAENCLCPAADESNGAGIVGVSHLNRDMLLSIADRDDYFSSHSSNVLRGRANDGDESPYMFRFIDEWIKQIQWNEVVYYNVFVSPFWMLPDTNFEESADNAKKLYRDSLLYLKYKLVEGTIENMTMTEFGTWYKENIAYGGSEINHWKDILCGSKRELVWYVEPSFRVAIDPNMGGAIVDLRPYAGQVERNLGPNTKHLVNGSYPYVISSDLRGGLWEGSIYTCRFSCNGKTVELQDKRTNCSTIKTVESNTIVEMNPITLNLGDIHFTVVSRYEFSRIGAIGVTRKLLDTSPFFTFFSSIRSKNGLYRQPS